MAATLINDLDVTMFSHQSPITCIFAFEANESLLVQASKPFQRGHACDCTVGHLDL